YLATVRACVRLRPDTAPAKPRATRAERRRALATSWPTLALFLLVVGGIYMGLFDPTEAAAFGVLGAALLARLQGKLSLESFLQCLRDMAVTTAMIFLILLGADFVNIFLALADFPHYVANLAANSGWHPYLILAAMIAFYLLLGCFMDSLAMIFLTVPVFWPIVAALDFGMPVGDLEIWYGIIVLVVVELGLITPPIGLNVLIINAQAPNVSLRETFVGVLPFLASDIVRVLLLVAFPGIALWLPHLLARL
ncbi:MAG: TRAP transporter large permease subunit, partial [Gammaproteobacteria bacterium]